MTLRSPLRRCLLAGAAALPLASAAAPLPSRGVKIVQLLDASTYQRDLARDHAAGLHAAISEHNRGRAGAQRPIVLEQVEVAGEAQLAHALAALRQDPATCALVGTAGESLALRSIALSRQQQLGLVHVAPWLADSRHDADTDVLPLFASRDMQVRHALAQLQGVGLNEMGVVYGTPQDEALYAGLLLGVAGHASARVRPLGTLESDTLARQLAAGGNVPAVLLFIGATVELARFTQLLSQRRLHRYVVSLADVELATLLQIGSGRSVPLIVTQVVPNPASSNLAVVRDYREQFRLLYDEAPTPLSLAGYLAGRYAAQVLARIDGPVNRSTVQQAFARRPSVKLDGFEVRFAGAPSRGSRFVTQTLLTGDGRLVG